MLANAIRQFILKGGSTYVYTLPSAYGVITLATMKETLMELTVASLTFLWMAKTWAPMVELSKFVCSPMELFISLEEGAMEGALLINRKFNDN